MKQIVLVVSICTIIIGMSFSFNDLKDKVVSNELIFKSELELFFPSKVSGFEEKFQCIGYSMNDSLFVCILEGVKLDSLYNVICFFDKGVPLHISKLAKSSFYREDGAIIEEYLFGRSYILNENHCLKVFFQRIKPMRIDTLSHKLRFPESKVVKTDSLTFCK